MQIKSTAVKAAVLAAALAFSGASFAATYNSQAVVGAGGLVLNSQGKNFNGRGSVGVEVINLTNTANAQDTFLAFCIEPTVDLQQKTVYTSTLLTGANAPSKAVQALYETSYASTFNDRTAQRSFQLALWELVADDGKLFAQSGLQYFSDANVYAQGAAGMLQSASLHTTLSNTYSYTSFSGIGANGHASQQLLGVSMMAAPVPEASTWAMLAAGLGLVGFTARRRGVQSGAKFA